MKLNCNIKNWIATLGLLLSMLLGYTVQAQVFIEGNVYGGGNAADVVSGSTDVTVEKGAMGSVYGGGNQGSIPSGNTTVTLLGGHVGYNLDGTTFKRRIHPKGIEKKWNGVYGGGYGESTMVSGVATVNVGKGSGMKENVEVYGSIYGGGEMGQVGTNNQSHQVIVKSDNAKTVHVEGAVFGGGRGYAVTSEGETITPTGSNAGAMKGDANVTVGTVGQDASKIQIDGMNYYSPQSDVKNCYYYAAINDSEKPIKWNHTIYRYDNVNKKFVVASQASYNPKETYYERMGAVAVVGGGEKGAVQGGNATVTISSGTMGSLIDGLIEGEVYGGGLNASVDGRTLVTVNGLGAWIRDAVYGGGCKGEVKNQNNEPITTHVNFVQGWARNVFGGSNMVSMKAGSKSKVIIGEGMNNDNNTIVSQSVYGGNGYSEHNGTTEVIIHRGRVGFVKAQYDINKEGDAITTNYYVEGAGTVGKGTIVPYHSATLVYDGSVYGGGFGPNASVTQTRVEMRGGIVKTGVFGGGELGPVAFDGATLDLTYKNQQIENDGSLREMVVKHTKKTGNITTILVSGGEVSMVFGGGRGFSNFLGDTKSPEPGAVFGNTLVEISGTAKISYTNMYRTYAAGNVYGGGMEGIVYGNTSVTVQGGNVVCNVYGGGRGFGTSYDKLMSESQNIIHRASVDAGALYGNTSVLVNAGQVGSSVYGGGEGWYAHTQKGFADRMDTTGTIRGNVKVDITGTTKIGKGYVGAWEKTEDWDVRGVFGGGRMASVWGYSDVWIHGSANVANVYGGNDISGRVLGKNRPTTTSLGSLSITKDTTATYVKIYENPKVGHVFGGGNGNYDYYENPQYTKMYATKPIQPSTYVDIKMEVSGFIKVAFGGGNAANVDTSRVYVYGAGVVDTVFGGGNAATVTTIANVHMNMPLISTDKIKYLFGGNNQATMDIIPNIYLASGRVMNVYGGGNAGEMTAREVRKDIFNQDVENLSTYVFVNSNQVVVSGALYGGCNHAKVHQGTFVDVRKTAPDGIANLYGGNDISNEVASSRIDMNGGVVHNIFGGGNGVYDYRANGSAFDVYANNRIIAKQVPGRPYTTETDVNIYGGTIKSNIYGGGNAGDCGNTNVDINDTYKNTVADAVIYGNIFGGGKGIMSTLGNGGVHVGNVTGLAKTELYNVKTLQNAVAYGGGNAGDVQNTLLTVHPKWNQSLDALYGGCYGSDVLGMARTILNCDTIVGKDKFNVRRLFGGNDFSGTVKNSVLTVNNGKYYVVYGAGNGRYDYEDVSLNPYNCTAPNSEMPTVNFYQGIVVNNLYGGGDMGYVYKKRTKGRSSQNIMDYAHIVVNIHGGKFMNNIFTGGAGSANQGAPQLVYGLKQLNMDGGYVRLSVYGGTENVKDGYPSECISATNTTKRPSSIMNIVGGVIDNHVYGGGYLGTVYGSIYLNIGKEAVENSPVWTTVYNGGTYSTYKPHFVTDATADTVDNLIPRTCVFNASIYNGANWGDAGAVYEFNTPGFIGGESFMHIDGLGYNTSISEEGSNLPFMDIHYSLIGAGTSCEGGDVKRDIQVKNYGVYYDQGCGVSKKIQSIQRADNLLLDKVAIELLGEKDAYTAYPSPNYSINRVDNVTMRGKNMVIMNSSVTNVKKLEFQNPDGSICNTIAAMSYNLSGDCDENTTACDKLNIANTKPYTTIMIRHGVSMDILYHEGKVDKYGLVNGYAYYVADDKTQATISARYKIDGSVNPTDGGFLSICNDENIHHGEFPYTNYENVYRVWRIGGGVRTRQVTILAHSDVTELPDANKLIEGHDIAGHENEFLAVAMAELRLPPADNGNYYKIQGGISVDANNSNEMKLLNTAFRPTSNWNASNKVNGEWNTISGESNQHTEIQENPTHVFGLVMESGHAFSTSCPSIPNTTCNHHITVSGNDRYAGTNGYISNTVTGSSEIFPTLKFYLTYSTNFASTILRDVTFTLEEFKSDGTKVGDINVTVTISTIIDKFKDESLEVLALYNEGRNNTFTRKFILPASLQRRDLYLTDVMWEPYTINNGGTGSTTNFGIKGCDNLSNLSNTTFGIELVPSEDITNTVTSTQGWYSIMANKVDPYNAADEAGANYNGQRKSFSKTKHDADGNNIGDFVSLLTTSNSNNGVYVGVLDGRSTAALNVVLHFDGNAIYNNNPGYVGRAIYRFAYYNAGHHQGYFDLTVLVKTREHGDTIYMASAPSITRGGKTINCYSPATSPNISVESIGKSPELYVNTFSQVMEYYQEGDVIAVMDKVNLSGDMNIMMRGSDYSIIELIRYSGSHSQFPGKNCSYRGPLIQLSGTSKFTAYNMIFDGGAVCKRTAAVGSPMVRDTMKAFAPIFVVKEGATLTLANKATVQNNYNAYTGTDKSLYGGAINLSGLNNKRPKLQLDYNVTIKDNLVMTAQNSSYDGSGAVFVNDGKVELGIARGGSKINIIDNYKLANAITYWASSPSGTRFVMNESVLGQQAKANVYLSRKATAANDNMHDAISDIILLKQEQSEGSKVGVSKWFPGPRERDTISISRNTEANQLLLERAISRKLFVSDNKNYNVFYSATINPLTIYLLRCASFQKQLAGSGNLYPNHPMKSVIEYIPNLGESCSSGIDEIAFSVRGGFYPYTYTWEVSNSSDFTNATELRTYTTPYTDDAVKKAIGQGDYSKALISNTDSIQTKKSPIGVSEASKTYYYRATAKDLMGCVASKTVKVVVKKSDQLSVNGVSVPGYGAGTGNASLQDTFAIHTATVDRYFQGIKLQTQVVADNAWGSISGKVNYNEQEVNIASGNLLCPGDRVKLKATPSANKKFIMWDFDPYDDPNTELVIPNKGPFTVTAYFGPNNYWTDAVISKPNGYTTQYNGDVDIYDENGLAWLISVVNGMNGEQARPFYFNKVTIHKKSNNAAYDMKAHLWTPIGSFENKFQGRLIVEDGVKIKNIYLNEPQMEYVGFFGHLEHATITKLNLQSVMAHGSQYVGGLAAEAVNSNLLGCSVTDHQTQNIITLLTTNYTSGGLVGKAERVKIASSGNTKSVAQAKYLGSAIYSGGVVGYGDNVNITSTHARTDDRMSALYMGGIIGYSTATGAPTNAKASAGESYIANNYVHYTTLGYDERVGGLVGFAKNTILENNYVYGETQAKLMNGAIGGMITSNVTLNNCFYQETTDIQPFGINGSEIEPIAIATFQGHGNQVKISESVGGINNLTRVLNSWVRENNVDTTQFLTWRSDLDTVNNGYPIFGEPDIIPIHDTIIQDACDTFVWNDVSYDESGYYSLNFIDSTRYIDSTITLNLIIHNSEFMSFVDSVLVGESYSDHGFYVSSTETELLRETVENEGVAVLQLSDTLQTEYGCDSIIVLNLTVYKDNNSTNIHEPLVLMIKVYPNPTTSSVMVESKGLISVEVFDDISRQVAYEEVYTDKCRINLDECAAGSYYLRIRTSQGVAIRKVIKK